ncbi:NUDIX hydrolase [Sediminitomix flava]|uniref:Mutator protein MutT n=1 Tax=Sediminitomix flava TaxID=379075 RepID=A0A315ZXI3_SEDFL|nr:NUDIX domain-containing protein [Sediminitomix flava]PWJ42057.1 mutator protein MutT [Sediminitomix flava]
MNTHPKNILKYCPKCGHDHFIYQKDDSFLCSSCDFRMYINAASAVAAILKNDKGEILFTRRKFNPYKGMLDLPGGFVDQLETAEDALKREIFEELQLNVSSIKYFGSFPNTYEYQDITYFTLDLTFEITVEPYEKIVAQDDITEALFIAADKIKLDDIGATSIKNITKAYLKSLSK